MLLYLNLNAYTLNVCVKLLVFIIFDFLSSSDYAACNFKCWI